MTGPSGAEAPDAFILANATIHTPPLVPEIRLYLASEISPIWQLTEDELDRGHLPPPYWAFAWAGGQALARYLLDCPEGVAGRTVLDFGSGSGLVAIAAAKAGAARVTAAEIDPFAVAALRLNVALNGVTVEIVAEDLIGTTEAPWEIILAGDVCYEQPMADRLADWLRMLVGRGATVLLGDPRRAYLPKQGLACIASYTVKTTRELEDADVRRTGVWRMLPASSTAASALA